VFTVDPELMTQPLVRHQVWETLYHELYHFLVSYSERQAEYITKILLHKLRLHHEELINLAKETYRDLFSPRGP